MARYLARIIRAIIVSTLGIGGGVALLVLIVLLTLGHDPQAFQHALRVGTFIGLILAIFWVAVFLPLDVAAHLFLPKGHYKEMWELEQRRDLVCEGTLKEIMAACRVALLAIPYAHYVSDDAEHLLAHASTGQSWRSFGEEVEVEINPIAEKKWHLKCTSRSRSPIIVFDWGKNYENVETWQKQLHKQVKAEVTLTGLEALKPPQEPGETKPGST